MSRTFPRRAWRRVIRDPTAPWSEPDDVLPKPCRLLGPSDSDTGFALRGPALIARTVACVLLGCEWLLRRRVRGGDQPVRCVRRSHRRHRWPALDLVLDAPLAVAARHDAVPVRDGESCAGGRRGRCHGVGSGPIVVDMFGPAIRPSARRSVLVDEYAGQSSRRSRGRVGRRRLRSSLCRVRWISSSRRSMPVRSSRPAMAGSSPV